MAAEWRTSTWGEEISLEYGKSLRGYDASKGKYRVFGSNGPIGWTSQPLAPGPGVILGRKGAYRGVQYSPDPFFVIDTAYYVVPIEDYWEKIEVVGIRCNYSEIKKGDRIAFELPVEYEEQVVDSLQVQNKPVEVATVGSLAGIKTNLSKEQAKKGIRAFLAK